MNPERIPSFETYRDEVWACERERDARMRAGIGPDGELWVDGQGRRICYAGPPHILTPEDTVRRYWVRYIEVAVRALLNRMFLGTAITDRQKHRALLKNVLGAVERSDPEPFDIDAAGKLFDGDQDRCTVSQELHQVVLLLGYTAGEEVPNEIRWAILDDLGLREPPAPAWAQVGAYAFAAWRGARGLAVQIERVDDRSVLLRGDRDPIPMATFLAGYEPIDPSAAELNGGRWAIYAYDAPLRELALAAGYAVLPETARIELILPDPLYPLRALAAGIAAALDTHPPREQLRAYVDRTIPDRAEHAALAAILERRWLTPLGIYGVLTGLRRREAYLRRGYRSERAGEEGLLDLVDVLDRHLLTTEAWGQACAGFDLARGRR